ncbi:lanthionine synthetase LanC family protein [Amycolatopsis nigrescens]|uniref:lanthionine synthetase LanC family protein n=1 Tax=Amycolatopsis nigrescens TaxID=381445 RepID=UPI0003709B64|nr:lanthionine synthetase LanC family protein [Amycolatopsis nigrescens]
MTTQTADQGRATSRELLTAAGAVLTSWIARQNASTAAPDLGPAVLATLVAQNPVASIAQHRVSHDAMRAWLRGSVHCRGPALHGGFAGVLAGMRLISSVHTDVTPAAERTAAALRTAKQHWRSSEVGFTDYDLVSGPAGALLALTTGEPTPMARHLAELAADPRLTGFRIGAHAGHPLLGWTQGAVITGLAHGVAGTLAALSMVSDRQAPGTLPAIRNLASWLYRHQEVDELGVVSWRARLPEPGSPALGVVRRQAWCYGNPGISWALWTAGCALRRAGFDEGRSLCDAALAAIRTFCDAYDACRHLDTERTGDALAICHGAAGILLVADAFDRQASFSPAAVLRERLDGFLRERLPEIVRLGDTDQSLLSGATGVLAALLTAAGADRGWLRWVALS